jgi:hypothetical protein
MSLNKEKFLSGKQPPQFCIIAPTTYLKPYAIMSTTHLVLAHLVETDPDYADFYKERSLAGDRIIMDNGAFELGCSYNPDMLVSLGNRCGAHALVLPDYPFAPGKKTIDAAIDILPAVKASGFAAFFAPQSKTDDLEDWIATYTWGATNPDIDIIGMSILGIPNALPHIPASYARVVMTQILIERNLLADKYHHYLGLNAGPALEIPSLIKMGALDSCDSSGPVWAAILGHEYSKNTDSYLATSKVKAHVEFDYPYSKDGATHERIQHNLDLTLDLFK